MKVLDVKIYDKGIVNFSGIFELRSYLNMRRRFGRSSVYSKRLHLAVF